MSFQSVIPVSGFAGWAFLDRTREVQQAAFEASPAMSRDASYFEERIGGVTTAEQLVGDRRLLRVALGAFGLGDDINNRFFLRKVLEDGTLDPSALANRLSDKRYLDFAKAFGFGDFATPRTVLSEFPAEIIDAYRTRQFEIAVGNSDPNLRMALGLDGALAAIAEKPTTETGRWYEIMGQPPVRKVFEVAFGLPASVGGLDLDRQVEEFRSKAAARFGDGEVAQFADPAKREELVRLFLLRADTTPGPAVTGQSAALTLLQSSGAAGSLLATMATPA